jgi:hypothetical protein
MTLATEHLPDDIAALKQIIADLARDAAVAQAEIAKLKFQLARYQRVWSWPISASLVLVLGVQR